MGGLFCVWGGGGQGEDPALEQQHGAALTAQLPSYFCPGCPHPPEGPAASSACWLRRKRQAEPADGRRRGRAQRPSGADSGAAAGRRASLHTRAQPVAATGGTAATGPGPSSPGGNGAEGSLTGASTLPPAPAAGSGGDNSVAAGAAPPGPPPPPAAAAQLAPAAGWDGGGGCASPPLPLLDFDLVGPEVPPLGDLPVSRHAWHPCHPAATLPLLLPGLLPLCQACCLAIPA